MTAYYKAQDLLKKFKQTNLKWDLLICADTIREKDNIIYEKPVIYRQ